MDIQNVRCEKPIHNFAQRGRARIGEDARSSRRCKAQDRRKTGTSGRTRGRFWGRALTKAEGIELATATTMPAPNLKEFLYLATRAAGGCIRQRPAPRDFAAPEYAFLAHSRGRPVEAQFLDALFAF